MSAGDFRLPGDELLLGALNGLAWPWLDGVFWLVSSRPFSFSVLLLVVVWLWRRTRAWMPVLVLLCALAATDALGSALLKPGLGRPRPFQALGTVRLYDPADLPGDAAMPSLHTANAFAVASVLGWYAPATLLWTIPLALLIGLSRIGLGVHWPSDVLAGALYGTAVGLLLAAGARAARRETARLGLHDPDDEREDEPPG